MILLLLYTFENLLLFFKKNLCWRYIYQVVYQLRSSTQSDMSSVDKVILDMLDKQLRDKVISFPEYMQAIRELTAAAASAPAANAANTSPSVDNQGKK